MFIAALVVTSTAALAQTSDVVKRGEYLANAADCVACHTKKDGKPYAGGFAIALPFGTLYSPNITPDRETGIGTYTDEEFVAAVRDGVAKGSKHLYPAMPYPSYALMSREDVLAIKAYLFSLPPEKSDIPANTVAFPFDQRWGMVFWNALFKPGSEMVKDPSRSEAWNRGAYLVEALGHCGECHTPRRITMNRNESQKFAGAVTQGWKAYNITADSESGIGAWSDDELASYLTTGHAPGRSSAAGPMAEVVQYSLRHLTAEDIKAMVTYLKTVPAIRNAPPIAFQPTEAAAKTAPGATPGLGERLFAGECANCHAWDGTGTQKSHASLVGSRTVNDPDATNLIAVLLSGAHLQASRTVFMPTFQARSDEELAALVNFTAARFGNGRASVTAADISAARSGTADLAVPKWLIWAGAAVAVLLMVMIIVLVIALSRRLRRRYA